MQEANYIKEEAVKLIESLPDNATWEDLTRLMLGRQMIEEGIADLDAGRFGPVIKFVRSWGWSDDRQV